MKVDRFFTLWVPDMIQRVFLTGNETSDQVSLEVADFIYKDNVTYTLLPDSQHHCSSCLTIAFVKPTVLTTPLSCLC